MRDMKKAEELASPSEETRARLTATEWLEQNGFIVDSLPDIYGGKYDRPQPYSIPHVMECFAGAASPAEGPTRTEDEWGKVYAEIRESKDPLIKLADSIVYHFAITKADLYQNEHYVKAVRHVAEQLKREGPKPSPRCPKCGSGCVKVDFGLTGFAADCKMCNHKWTGELALTPSAGTEEKK